MSEQLKELSGLFTDQQIEALAKVFADKKQVDDMAIEVDSFSTDIHELSDLKKEIEDHEHTDIDERLDSLEEICDKYDLRSMERSIEDLTDKVNEIEDVETPQPTTFKEVWQILLSVLKLKFQSLRG